MLFSKKTDAIQFTNTLSGKKEGFVPLKRGQALLYSCGPTVYGPLQIGNLRSFVLADLVGRTLKTAGYKVTRVMNITDVGHLVGDADEGEDKMKVGASRDNTTPEAIADKYAKVFLDDIKALNVQTSEIRFPRATQYIKEDIRMIKALEKHHFTYNTSEGVYFDTSKFPDYGTLAGMKNAELRAGARVDVGEKRSPHDFVLWRTAKAGDLQKWNSPWGEGNPGWSIECSAMSTALLGEQIDIHTGGEDLASIHHNNEIAQSEGASGKHPFVKYWLHNAFLTMNGEKLSKSAGNSFTLADIVAKGYHPLALRYLFLQAHYRSPLSFSWEALEAADVALHRLWKQAAAIKVAANAKEEGGNDIGVLPYIYDDLNTPGALAWLWGTLDFTDSARSPAKKWKTIVDAEKVLGLLLTNPPEAPKTLSLSDLPEDVRSIATEREEARKNKDFAKSDELRIHLSERGYAVEDTPLGTIYTPRQTE